MTLKEIAQLLDAKVICGSEKLEREIHVAFASDLMSDVLTVPTHDMLLVTGLSNVQTIRTSEMADISNIIFVRNKKVSDEMLEIAEENDMVLLECPYSMFKASGMLYQAGLKPVY